MKIFIDENKIGKENLNQIKEEFPQLEFLTNIEVSYDAEIIFVEPSYLKLENINKYQNLKWIQSYRAGFDNVDLEYLKSRDILFSNARDIYSIPIAEDVLTKILVLNRDVRGYLRKMKNKEWQPNYNEPEIYNSTIGIIGMGSIAKEIAKRIKAFGTKVLGYRKNFKEEEYFDEVLVGSGGLEHLLRESDYVILTLPLNEETKGMLNKEKFEMMKTSALFINIGRGPVVVEEDLITALKTNQIRGAALDVFEVEPLPITSQLWTLDNVYLTPHCSAASPHTNQRLSNLFITNIKRYLNKEELLHRIV